MKEVERNQSARYSVAISAAADLFLENGIKAVKMVDIAKKSHVSVSALYRVFESKSLIAIRAGMTLWNKINEEFDLYLDGDTSTTGLEQIIYCFGFFMRMFDHHKPFITFVDELDRLILSEELPLEWLLNYESSIVNLSAPFADAFEKGVKDGSIRSDVNFPLFYNTMTHALISAGIRFIRGSVLPHDNYAAAGKEIEKLMSMGIKYISA